jgi:hypothetical protein
MKMADILRDLANKLDGIENGGGHEEAEQGHLEPVEVARTDSDEVDSGHFMPPLQQKLELLKKGVGVANAFDQHDAGAPDELDDIKRLTGIDAVMQQEAAEDNDIVG